MKNKPYKYRYLEQKNFIEHFEKFTFQVACYKHSLLTINARFGSTVDKNAKVPHITLTVDKEIIERQVKRDLRRQQLALHRMDVRRYPHHFPPRSPMGRIKHDKKDSVERRLRCSDSVIVVPTESGSIKIPSCMPKISTVVKIRVAPTHSVLIIELDERAIPESVHVYCDLKQEIVRLVYDRAFMVNKLSSVYQQMVSNGHPWWEDEQSQQYELTTHVEHPFKFPSQDYALSMARVKQNGRTVLITVPLNDSHINNTVD
ncbi:hypothetical protein CSKR_106232 [Clonorchis sinensis]|uniref:Uncharacterized protein n=1 Tax=Clonorchis sinensis TaxID=79923 RepID=A0A3R7CYV0_CLOSI|nr:hypothetical protein CSKR_106232 [Clonorchis sinensis]